MSTIGQETELDLSIPTCDSGAVIGQLSKLIYMYLSHARAIWPLYKYKYSGTSNSDSSE